MTWSLHLDQTQNNQNCRYCLGNNGCQCNTGNTHLEHNNKKQVQNNIDHTRQGQKVQRTFGITDCTKDRCTKVIQHKCRHTDKVNAHIQNRKINNVFRSSHQFQKRFCKQNTHENQDDTTNNCGQNRGVNCFMHAIHISCAIKTCNHNVCTDRNTNKQVDDQVDKR